MTVTTTELLPSTDVLLGMFETMTRIKKCDERFRSLINAGRIVVTYYSPRGQECVPAAFSVVLRRDDYLVTTYRGLHDHIGKGIDLRRLWAEFLGRRDGTCKGKGGPMHITDVASGVMVTTGIVGGGLPIATGLGLAAQLNGRGQVAVVNFGDGASNIGAFHEALNLAGLWSLPVVFVCQNNRYAEHTPFAAGTSAHTVADRAAGYGMPGVVVDGNDPIAMFEAAGAAVERARAGEGPTLIEAMTYRFFGHIMGDTMEYMPKAEREAAMEADPVPAYRRRLLELGVTDEAGLAAVEARIEAEVDDAVAFATASEPPAPEELDRDVYGEAAR